MAELEVTPHRRTELRATAGLCADCRHLRLLGNGRSIFVRCRRSEGPGGDAWPRYPHLPVRRCPGLESA